MLEVGFLLALLATACGSAGPQTTPPTANPLPAVSPTPEEPPTPTLAPTLSLEQITPPADSGVVVRDGKWFLQDREVILTQHVNEDGSIDIWFSYADSPDWPLAIQNDDDTWRLGAEAWTGTITIINTNEVPLAFRSGVAGTENQVSESAEAIETGETGLELSALEILSFSSVPPGTYELSFSFNIDQAIELSCTIEMQTNSNYSFIIIPTGVAITEANFSAQSGRDLDVRTSSLCGY